MVLSAWLDQLRPLVCWTGNRFPDANETVLARLREMVLEQPEELRQFQQNVERRLDALEADGKIAPWLGRTKLES